MLTSKRYDITTSKGGSTNIWVILPLRPQHSLKTPQPQKKIRIKDTHEKKVALMLNAIYNCNGTIFFKECSIPPKITTTGLFR
jgi:hypothetical protein